MLGHWISSSASRLCIDCGCDLNVWKLQHFSKHTLHFYKQDATYNLWAFQVFVGIFRTVSFSLYPKHRLNLSPVQTQLLVKVFKAVASLTCMSSCFRLSVRPSWTAAAAAVRSVSPPRLRARQAPPNWRRPMRRPSSSTRLKRRRPSCPSPARAIGPSLTISPSLPPS